VANQNTVNHAITRHRPLSITFIRFTLSTVLTIVHINSERLIRPRVVLQVEDGVTGRRRYGERAAAAVHGWRMCGSDAATGWAAETGRTFHITFHSDQQFDQRDAAPPDIGAWIRFARQYTLCFTYYLHYLQGGA